MIDSRHTSGHGRVQGRLATGRALVMLAVCGLSGCQSLAGAVVSVKNVGTQRLDDIALDVGGRTVAVTSLPVGEERTVQPDVIRDSSLRITYSEAGKTVVCEGDVYFTNNLRVRVTADIGGGTCRVLDITD